MTQRYPILYRSLQAVAVLATLIMCFLPAPSPALEYLMAIGLILLIGMPHGATDYLIFKHLTRPFLGSRSMRRFYLNYLLLMGGYGILWVLLPGAALALFLLLSMYHFGQANWNYVATLSPTQAHWSYLIWGAFVVLAPLVIHYETASGIIAQLIRAEAPAINATARQFVFWGLAGLNVLTALIFWWRSQITLQELRDELINLIVLGAVFYTLPLLLGFTVFFVGWHSLSSIMDQIRFFRQHYSDYGLSDYALNTLPLTVAAIAGLGILIGAAKYFGHGAHIGQLFIFISIVTLPHMILIDRLYEELEAETHTLPTEKKK